MQRKVRVPGSGSRRSICHHSSCQALTRSRTRSSQARAAGGPAGRVLRYSPATGQRSGWAIMSPTSVRVRVSGAMSRVCTSEPARPFKFKPLDSEPGRPVRGVRRRVRVRRRAAHGPCGLGDVRPSAAMISFRVTQPTRQGKRFGTAVPRERRPPPHQGGISGRRLLYGPTDSHVV